METNRKDIDYESPSGDPSIKSPQHAFFIGIVVAALESLHGATVTPGIRRRNYTNQIAVIWQGHTYRVTVEDGRDRS